MSTILKQGKRRCDAVCHRAKGTSCGCICGGKFHGATVTASKTAERAEIEDIVLTQAMQSIKKLGTFDVTSNADCQPSLFTDEDLDAAYKELSKGK
jgi:hypothetical protein